MAPPPEYDKEPKAPDKNATTTSNEDSKFSNSINDQQTKSDHKNASSVANSEGEKSKADNSVENLDDGRLRALLDEAITYKCPKDREGKSDLFKNLLEEAEQDDQASEAAARSSGGRARRGAGRRALAHSNSLQDLVAAALAAEPAPRRPRPHAPVSARATHGGSLPSGVDTSFLLGEEPTRGGYLATVRCVNPPPLAERRVSASDANCPAEVELLHRRSKPVFPMTYTARATLEIGSGSVSSGRAVTTTTASNQVRTFRQPRPTFGPPERIYAGHSALYDPSKQDANQTKLMNALLCSRNKNMSPLKSGLRGPRSGNENSGSPWSEIIARYTPVTIASPIKPLPEDATTISAKGSTEPFRGKKITARNTSPELSLEKKVVMPTCANPSTNNKVKATNQTIGLLKPIPEETSTKSTIRSTEPISDNKISSQNTCAQLSLEKKVVMPTCANSSTNNKIKATSQTIAPSKPIPEDTSTKSTIRSNEPFPGDKITSQNTCAELSREKKVVMPTCANPSTNNKLKATSQPIPIKSILKDTTTRRTIRSNEPFPGDKISSQNTCAELSLEKKVVMPTCANPSTNNKLKATGQPIPIKSILEDTTTRPTIRSTEPFPGNKITSQNTCAELSLEKKVVMRANPSTDNKSKATSQTIPINPIPEDTTTRSTILSNEPFSSNKIASRNTSTELSLEKKVKPTSANPSNNNKLKATNQNTNTSAKTNKPSSLTNPCHDKNHPTTRIKPPSKTKITSSTAQIALTLGKKKVLPLGPSSSLSENKMPKFSSQPGLSQENQTTLHARETRSSPENGSMVPDHLQAKRKPDVWMDGVTKWYEDLSAFEPILQNMNENFFLKQTDLSSNQNRSVGCDYQHVRAQDTTNTFKEQNSHRPREPYNTNMHINPVISVYGTHKDEKLGKSFSKTISNSEFEDKETYGYEDEEHSHLSENNMELEESDIRLRKKYRKDVGHSLTVPSLSSINPRNIRPMSIGKIPPPVIKTLDNPKNKDKVKPLDFKNVKNDLDIKDVEIGTKIYKKSELMKTEKCDTPQEYPASEAPHSLSNSCDIPKFVEMVDVSSKIIDCTLQQQANITDIEMVEIVKSGKEDKSEFINVLQELKEVRNEDPKELELKDMTASCDHYEVKTSFEQYNSEQQNFLKMLKETTEDAVSNNNVIFKNDIETLTVEEDNNAKTLHTRDLSTAQAKLSAEDTTSSNIVIKLNKKPEAKVSSDQYIIAELPNNAYVFLTMPERLFTPAHNMDKTVKIQEIPNDVSANVEAKSNNVVPKNTKKKKDKAVGLDDAKKKENLNKTALKVLLFENLKRDRNKAEASSEANKEGDSAIPFSCITTPEVVSSCNTTSSTTQSAVAVDPKPRSVISSSFNGLTLSRPNYGATASAADEYKKSLDENGNAVQGFSSPVSGSSQHKKPRRKKSSKNETVIKSHQIDGYQGNKDLNEVLRFIESNAEHGRGTKLGRAKHKDDADDKAGKKRSSERRKDKEKVKRASSLEERSRTKLEDLTDTPLPRRPAAHPRPDDRPKPERRSWGDDARDAFYYPAPEPDPAPAPEPERPPAAAPAPAPAPPPADAAAELTDFQTVTKRRKPRRRPDEAEREPPRRPRPPSPRPRRESAPPSDRSNDSNDDLDSVHSLPPPPPPAPHASYADIARTRHNIPDLIESCNFYAEGEGVGGRRVVDAPLAAGDADGYPALGGAARAARGKAPPRRERKERPGVAEGPAPDVVGDRRPAVILLDSAARPRDMDGVTFGFDVNEQLLGGCGGARRPARCDLVRDATPALPALRYRPPDPPPDTAHLHQIIDYVASAWEDVIRCGGGKVRYFSD